MTSVYLSLGTNMGNRMDYLKKAVSALSKLPKSKLISVSSVYETAAWGLTDQADFLNIACHIETDLASQDLLLACQEIERQLDRVRHEHWGPRTIDIDILLFGQDVIDTDNLKVPHPYMTQRAFVLVPLAEIASHLNIPGVQQSVSHCLLSLDTKDIAFHVSSEALLKK